MRLSLLSLSLSLSCGVVFICPLIVAVAHSWFAVDSGTPGAEGVGEEIVTMEKWGKILAWFGPLVDLKHGVIILDKVL
jgi:hypothetical protein